MSKEPIISIKVFIKNDYFNHYFQQIADLDFVRLVDGKFTDNQAFTGNLLRLRLIIIVIRPTSPDNGINMLVQYLAVFNDSVFGYTFLLIAGFFQHAHGCRVFA